MALDFADSASSISTWLQALIPALSPTAPVVSAETQAYASVIAELSNFLSSTANNAFLDTSAGAALTAKAADLGVQRTVGTPSTASLTVTLSGLQPSGWQIDSTFTFATAGDALNAPTLFVPTGITTTTPGQTTATVAVQSASIGSAANVAIGTIAKLVGGSPFVLDVTNSAAATGGTDAMSDAQLLTQAQAALVPPGTVAQMQKVAAGVTGTTYPIVAAVVVDLQDGNGTVDVYAINTINTLPGATTTPSATVTSDALLIQNAEKAIAPPGLTIKVALLAVTSQNVTISVKQVAGSGLNATIVEAAITTYLTAFQPGQTYYPSQLVQYLFTTAFPGLLVDAEPSSMTPVTVSATGIIRAGTISATVT